ncbi:hypothetical protein ADUPG1_010788 [Aduncisulcus paluster]|uniref:Uncharacterized protein n=1 Tax=Aduncisulcus paluster TaxID=2918883 RepID=A0ABQ5JTZ4_9EUKA|nr:hypothetical protein ADUPG1_010788 [Aduncisulcus paluster]
MQELARKNKEIIEVLVEEIQDLAQKYDYCAEQADLIFRKKLKISSKYRGKKQPYPDSYMPLIPNSEGYSTHLPLSRHKSLPSSPLHALPGFRRVSDQGNMVQQYSSRYKRDLDGDDAFPKAHRSEDGDDLDSPRHHGIESEDAYLPVTRDRMLPKAALPPPPNYAAPNPPECIERNRLSDAPGDPASFHGDDAFPKAHRSEDGDDLDSPRHHGIESEDAYLPVTRDRILPKAALPPPPNYAAPNPPECIERNRLSDAPGDPASFRKLTMNEPHKRSQIPTFPKHVIPNSSHQGGSTISTHSQSSKRSKHFRDEAIIAESGEGQPFTPMPTRDSTQGPTHIESYSLSTSPMKSPFGHGSPRRVQYDETQRRKPLPSPKSHQSGDLSKRRIKMRDQLERKKRLREDRIMKQGKEFSQGLFGSHTPGG